MKAEGETEVWDMRDPGVDVGGPDGTGNSRVPDLTASRKLLCGGAVHCKRTRACNQMRVYLQWTTAITSLPRTTPPSSCTSTPAIPDCRDHQPFPNDDPRSSMTRDWRCPYSGEKGQTRLTRLRQTTSSNLPGKARFSKMAIFRGLPINGPRQVKRLINSFG